MKTKPLIASILLLAMLAGCAGSPKAKAYAFHRSYTAVLTSIDQAAHANKIPPQAARDILLLRPIADAAEKAIDDSKAVGGATFNAALDAGQRVLDQLIAAYSKGGK